MRRKEGWLIQTSPFEKQDSQRGFFFLNLLNCKKQNVHCKKKTFFCLECGNRSKKLIVEELVTRNKDCSPMRKLLEGKTRVAQQTTLRFDGLQRGVTLIVT